MHIFLNGLGASAGAGLTYIRNVVPQLSSRTDVCATLALSRRLREELGKPPNIFFIERDPAGPAARFLQEQTLLPSLIKESKADILLSAGNFAVRKSPVPQILLSGNSLYTSADFKLDLCRRRDYRAWIDTQIRGIMAKRSIHWADCTVAPSHAFAEELQAWTGIKPQVVYHGFDRDTFLGDDSPLPPLTQQKLAEGGDALRLLFVSHYTYYRNFETLIQALPLLKKALSPRKVRLVLTCEFCSEKNPGSYHAEGAAELVRQLDLSGEVVELGAVPYRLLHRVYRACDIYVTAAYAETFAHPLVEAMSCGLPVVASDLPVHREVCGPAAVHFQRFSPQGLVDKVLDVVASPELAARMSAAGRVRSRSFSWSKHVDQLLCLADGLIAQRVQSNSR